MIRAYFHSMPTWYRSTLLAFFIVYLGIWTYTIHLAHVERAQGQAIVMPVGPHDSTDYALLSESVLHGEFHLPDRPHESFHTPGYPVFAAIILFFTHGSFFAVTFVQILLAFGIALMTRALGKKLVSKRVGDIASLLFLANPLLPSIVFYVLTDTLFAFLLTLGFYVLVLHAPKRLWFSVIAASVVFGAAAYVRPVGFIAFPIFAAPILALRLGVKRTILAVLVLWMVIAGLLVPWMWRNKVESGVFAFSSLVELNFAFYAIPHFWNLQTGLPFGEGIERVERESGVPRGLDAQGYPANWYDIKSSPALGAYAKSVILKDPVRYISWHLYNSTGFFLNPPLNPPHPSENLKQLLLSREWGRFFRAATSPWWYFLERLAILCGILLITIGAWTLRRKPLAWAFAFVIVYLAALGGPASQARYRLPVDSFLCIFTTVGIGALLKGVRPSRATNQSV